jgi:hypothetical protein
VGVIVDEIVNRQERRELGTEVLSQNLFGILKEFFHIPSFDHLITFFLDPNVTPKPQGVNSPGRFESGSGLHGRKKTKDPPLSRRVFCC